MSTKFTDQLFDAAQPIWAAQVDHPFVQGIADGTLEVDTFKNWVRQDYLYLKEFSRVFAWATAKADSLDSMQWYATVLDMTLNTEMSLHRSYAADFGINEDDLENERMWPTTRAYTDFLVRTAADGDMVDLLAGLLPCAWGYAWVGEQLVESGADPQDERYEQWLETYTDDEFKQAAEWLKSEINELAEGQTDAKKSDLLDTFVLSSRYEWRFWEMCYNGEEWRT
jgi:thiaminase/transcriptional activator TenA